MKKTFNYATLLFALLYTIAASAQDFSNKGKDFWIGYGNHVRMFNTGVAEQMQLYITSDVNTTGNVTISSIGFNQNFTVTANQITTINIPRSAALLTQGLYNHGIHVTTVKAVVVYSFIYVNAVSGATVCLPTNTLGKEYYSVNYTQLSNELNSHSYFFVIAADTGTTTVEITPSATTRTGQAANVPFTVTLTQGQIYQVLGQNSGASSGVDLTGSKIRSINTGAGCKKIGVYCGSGKISIGCSDPSVGSSDNLYQQMYPYSAWGKTYITVPTTNNSSNFQTNFYRIVRPDATAIVKLNGTIIPAASFTNSFFYQFNSNTTNVIESDKPILVAQYFTTSATPVALNCGNSGIGDPEMIYLNPVEQTIKDVTINSMQPSSGTAITTHFLNIVLPNNSQAINSFRIDGNTFASSFSPVLQDPKYAYARIPVSSQGHTVICDSGFNLISYGFGAAESYGYSGGTNLRDLYQFVSIQNSFAIVNFPATCKGSPFLMSMTFPYQPLEISWKFNGLFADTSIVSPAYDSTWVVNGRTLYRYKLPRAYFVNNIGLFPIKVLAKNPTPDGCTGEQEIDYEIEVFNPPAASFNFTNNGCLSDSVKFKDISALTGRPPIRWAWDFGDGTTSYVREPIKLYSTPNTNNVKFSVINDIGCISDTASKLITLFDPPVAKYIIKSTLCIGKSITFSDSSYAPAAATITKWTWNFGDGTPVVVANSNVDQTHVFATNGSFDVTLIIETSTGCKSFLYKRRILISPFPKADFSLPNVCLPVGSAQFNNLTTISAGTLSYTWDFGNMTTAGNVLSPEATYTAVGPYSVKLTAISDKGCTHDTTKVLSTIYAEPKAIFTAPLEVCLGDSAIFSESSFATNSTVTQWLWDFGDGTNSTLKNPPPKTYTISNTYTITLTVKSVIGCSSAVTSKPIVVNPLPKAQFSIVNPSCEKQQISFIDASVANAGNITTWNWDFKDGDLKTYVNGNPFNKRFDTAGNYNVLLEVVTNKGCKNILTKNIRVNTLPVPNFILPKVCLDDANAFFKNTTTIADGTTASLIYNWNFGDMNSTAANNVSTLKDPIHKYSQLGNYFATLKVTSVDGCIKDTVRAFTVNGSTPVANFSIINPLGLCGNTLTRIQNTSTVAFGSVTDIRIKWDTVGAPFIDSIDSSPKANKIYNTKYPDFQSPLIKDYWVKMYAYSGSSCVDSIRKMVTINASPKVSMLTLPGICNEASPRLLNQGSESGLVPGTFIYRGTNISSAGLFNPNSLAPNNYDIEYVYTSNKGCRDSITKPITVWPSPVAKWSNSTLNCEKNAITFSDSSIANYSNIVSWKWDFGSGGPAAVNQTNASPFVKTFNAYGSYNIGLQVFTDSGCQSTVVSKLLNVHPLPRVDFKIPEICLPNGRGQFFDQSSIPVGTSSAFRFNWNFGDGGMGSVLKDPFYTFSNVGPYTIKLVVTSEFNCVDSLSKLDTTIYPQPKANFAVDKMETCLGGIFNFTDQSNGKTSLVNAWNWDFSGNVKSNIQNPRNTYVTAGTYNVSLFIYNQQGCVSDTVSKIITVHPYPTVNAGKDLFVLEGGQLTLNPLVSGNNLSFLWLPNQYLDNNTLQMPVTKPLDDITYIIRVTGIGGCNVQDDVFIKVLKQPEIPNAFSPNGDGINDLWVIKYLESYPGTIVEIYNRYGQILFRSVGYDKPWDGTFKGKQVPSGTYYYIVDPKNNRKQIAGFVDIVR